MTNHCTVCGIDYERHAWENEVVPLCEACGLEFLTGMEGYEKIRRHMKDLGITN